LGPGIPFGLALEDDVTEL